MPQTKPIDKDYYVYEYSDPRTEKVFYYGKGKGARKLAHLGDKTDSEKTRRITEIQKDGLSPVIRVIAKGLTEDEAYLVEKTLLWKLMDGTTNKSTGRYSKNFRPANSQHKQLHGFDFENQLYYFNCGENEARNWDDFMKYGYISGGYGPRYRNAMLSFREGDVIVAYLNSHGYVGVGRVGTVAKMIRDFQKDGVRLLDRELVAERPGHDISNKDQCEYACAVKWIKSVPRERAFWTPNTGLYTTTLVRASLENQRTTIDFVEKNFGVSFSKLLK